MTDPAQTEPAEIYGGHLDGMRLSVACGMDRFYLRRALVLENGTVAVWGAVWGAGNDGGQLFGRTDRRLASGKIVFVPVEPQVTA